MPITPARFAMTDLQRLLAGADAIASRAAALLVAMQRQDIGVTRKEHRDVVTAADLASEKLVIEGLRTLTPGRRDPLRGSGRERIGRGRALDRRPARRHRELRRRPALVLRDPRLSGERAHPARHHPRPGRASIARLPGGWRRRDRRTAGRRVGDGASRRRRRLGGADLALLRRGGQRERRCHPPPRRPYARRAHHRLGRARDVPCGGRTPRRLRVAQGRHRLACRRRCRSSAPPEDASPPFPAPIRPTSPGTRSPPTAQSTPSSSKRLPACRPSEGARDGAVRLDSAPASPQAPSDSAGEGSTTSKAPSEPSARSGKPSGMPRKARRAEGRTDRRVRRHRQRQADGAGDQPGPQAAACPAADQDHACRSWRPSTPEPGGSRRRRGRRPRAPRGRDRSLVVDKVSPEKAAVRCGSSCGVRSPDR